MDHSPTLNIITLEENLQKEYREILKREELIWFQKSCEDWIRSGYRNTKFFHTQTIVRRHRNSIHNLKLDDGTWCSDANILKAEA